MNKKISVVIACYQDGLSIVEMYNRLCHVFNKILFDYEFIFVNDGSSDDSEEILRLICKNDQKVIAIFHSRNFGYQNAFSSGMTKATGDATILLDGDMQDPPELIPEFISKWIGGYDVVYGERVSREASLIMNFAYKTFYIIFNKISYIHIPLDAGEFSLMDKKVSDQIILLKESDRFIRGLRAWVGFKQIGIPYKRDKRKYGKSNFSILGNFKWAKKGIFSFSFFPLEFISYVSYILFIFSVYGIIFNIIYYLFGPEAPRGIYAIIVLILFLGSTNLLFLSILSEYICKILEESKKRPQFIIKEIINDNKKT